MSYIKENLFEKINSKNIYSSFHCFNNGKEILLQDLLQSHLKKIEIFANHYPVQVKNSFGEYGLIEKIFTEAKYQFFEMLCKAAQSLTVGNEILNFLTF